MCILFIYRNPNAKDKSYRLIIATNRDEYFNRSARPAEYWSDHPGCLGGRDYEVGKEGGTWFALSVPKGRAGIILNLHEDRETANDSDKKGRGFLVSDYITSEASTETHLQNLHRENQKSVYNPYSLILVDLKNADVYYTNNAKHSTGPPRLCPEKILAFGNTTPESPYKKVEAGREKFENITNNVDCKTIDHQSKLVEDLFDLLKWKERHLPDIQLQTRHPETYEALSSVCVYEKGGIYGTRTHSILLVDASNKMTFYEETFMPDTSSWKLQKFEDIIPKY